jgi:hypothetical protein
LYEETHQCSDDNCAGGDDRQYPLPPAIAIAIAIAILIII